MRSYARAERGASAAEYALMLAIVGAMIAASMLFLGSAVGNSINNSGELIASASSTQSQPGTTSAGKALVHASGHGNAGNNGNAGGNGKGKGKGHF